jgi:hypothetical protein
LAIKKLVCDRCGVILDIKEDIELALEGTASWHAFIRARGEQPRGLFPCRNWIQCQGEMIDEKELNARKGGKTN